MFSGRLLDESLRAPAIGMAPEMDVNPEKTKTRSPKAGRASRSVLVDALKPVGVTDPIAGKDQSLPLLSLVFPCFNEQEVLPRFFTRVIDELVVHIYFEAKQRPIYVVRGRYGSRA